MVQIKKVAQQCGPGPVVTPVGRFAALQQQRCNPLAGPPSLSDCLERAESVQPSGLAVKGGTWHYRTQGEAHLATLRKSRAEVREARMRELECKQREQDLDADRAFDLQQLAKPLDRSAGSAGSVLPPSAGATAGGSHQNTSTSALNAPRMERAVEQLAAYGDSLAQAASSDQAAPASVKAELYESFSFALQEVRDCFRAEREVLSFQVELLKDSQTEAEESHSQLQREHRERCKELDAVKRDHDKVKEELRLVQGQLQERDELLAKRGYIIVTVENEDGTDAHRELVSSEHAHLLESASGSLDDYLAQFTKEKAELEKQLAAAQLELKEQQSTIERLGVFYGEVLNEDELEWRKVKRTIGQYKQSVKGLENENDGLHSRLRIAHWKAESSEEQAGINRQKLLREKNEEDLRAEELQARLDAIESRQLPDGEPPIVE